MPTLASRARDVATSNPACVWVLPLLASDDSTCMLQTHSEDLFVHYAMGLLHVGLSSPVDILFLTAFVLKASSGHGRSLDVGQLGSMQFKLHCKA